MEIVQPNKKGLKKAALVLKKGGVVVYPTDTAYGLGGIYNSQKVINKILKIKNRRDRRFTVISSSFNQVANFFKLNSYQEKFIKKYWPGPVSLVVSKNYSVRVPKNKIAVSLVRQIGKPLIATSANLTGGQELYDAKKIVNLFKNKKYQPDLVIDGGVIKKVKPSTIVLVKKDGVKILRPGAIKL